MEQDQAPQPWEELRELATTGDTEKLEAFIETLDPNEAIRAIFRLDSGAREAVLTTLSPAEAADLIEEIPDEHAADMIERLDASDAAAILNEMQSDDQADVLGEMNDTGAEAILAKMEPGEAKDARRLMSYGDDVAGGLMMTETVSFPEQTTVGEAIEELSRIAETDSDIYRQSLYVVSGWRRLVGVADVSALVLTPRSAPVADIMTVAAHVRPDTSLDQLNVFCDRNDIAAVPVIDEHVRLLGVVTRNSVTKAMAERAEEERRKMQGIIGGDEIRTMPILRRSRRRLSWLSVNIVLNIIAASVIAFYEDTLSAVIALAVFLPIVSDMSGCTGNQAVAVSMRELALGIVKPFEVFRVWWQEASVGLINGVALGSLLGVAAWLWKGNPYLGLVVGGALAANSLIAVSIGGTVPLLLKRAGVDPAIASGPILTTVTDMCGFLLVLSIAAAMLPLLTTG
jgi:magnesium transporter